MSAHTPGPWVLGKPLRAYEASVGQAGKPGVVVADVPNPDNSNEGDAVALANAVLIAAAPDLLSALEMVDACLCSGSDPLTNPLQRAVDQKRAEVAVRAAIAKAKGKAPSTQR